MKGWSHEIKAWSGFKQNTRLGGWYKELLQMPPQCQTPLGKAFYWGFESLILPTLARIWPCTRSQSSSLLSRLPTILPMIEKSFKSSTSIAKLSFSSFNKWGGQKLWTRGLQQVPLQIIWPLHSFFLLHRCQWERITYGEARTLEPKEEPPKRSKI